MVLSHPSFIAECLFDETLRFEKEKETPITLIVKAYYCKGIEVFSCDVKAVKATISNTTDGAPKEKKILKSMARHEALILLGETLKHHIGAIAKEGYSLLK